MFQQYDGLSNFEIKHSSGFGHNIEETLKSDVVIIMRPVLNCIEHIRFLRKNGVKVVLDYDDAFPYVNHNDQFFLRSSMEFLELVKECDLITTSTDRLKYYFSLLTDVQCVVLPNIINPIYVNQYKVKNEDKIVLGWFGSSGHISSLRPIKDVIIKVLNEFENVYFNLYTDNPEIVNLFYHPKTNFIPYNFKFDQFQNSLGDVDINIAPINETYINLHKSNIRIILPGYKGIPSVASNFGEYKDMGKENVLLCDTPQDWYENLKEIILNEEKRKTLSKNIKELVESKFIFQKWGNYKKEIFEKLS